MARRRNPIFQWCVTTLCLGFGSVTLRLPIGACRRLGTILGLLAYYLVPRIRRVSLENLDLAYGDTLSPREKWRIARASAINIGIIFAEFTKIPLLDGDFLREQVTPSGFDALGENKAIILIGGHLGNWEWIGPCFRKFGGAITEVVRPLDDRRLDDAVERIRRSNGIGTVSKHGAAAEIVRLLNLGTAAGILVDQSPRQNGIPVTVFGSRTWSTIGPALIHARTGAPVYVGAVIRQPDGRYRYTLSGPLDLVTTDSAFEDLIKNTQRCQEAVEALVRQYPEQWLWAHRRWKPRPALEKEWEERLARARGSDTVEHADTGDITQ